ncbi:MAG: phosphoribosylamine--glycine ligase N-terminal domain-containing protein, partial [PS1 clade bacterium]
MKILVIGSGGREHALAWQCAKFDNIEQVFVAPGNAGTELESKITNIDIGSDDIEG